MPIILANVITDCVQDSYTHINWAVGKVVLLNNNPDILWQSALTTGHKMVNATDNDSDIKEGFKIGLSKWTCDSQFLWNTWSFNKATFFQLLINLQNLTNWSSNYSASESFL